MKYDIHDLLDGIEDGSVDIRADTPAPERIKEIVMQNIEKTPKKRFWRTGTILIAAVLTALALTISVMAAETASIMNGTEALRILNRELDSMRELGIISLDVDVTREDCEHIFLENDPTSFQVFCRDYVPNFYIAGRVDKFYMTATVNTDTGRIVELGISAPPEEGEPSTREFTDSLGNVMLCYANFHDFMDDTQTVGEFCDKLANYWGFTGCEIEGAEGSALLRDQLGARITVYFEGDEGLPRYIELWDYPLHCQILFGLGHSVG